MQSRRIYLTGTRIIKRLDRARLVAAEEVAEDGEMIGNLERGRGNRVRKAGRQP